MLIAKNQAKHHIRHILQIRKLILRFRDMIIMQYKALIYMLQFIMAKQESMNIAALYITLWKMLR